MELELVRCAYLPDVTLGWLRVRDRDLRLATLEEPWRADPDGPGGQRRIGGLPESCIPDGRYRVRRHSSARWPAAWRLSSPALGVWDWPGEIPAGQPWGRSAILIHSGVDITSIMGCILVGRQHIAPATGQPFRVARSRDALQALNAALADAGDQHELLIRPTKGTTEVIP